MSFERDKGTNRYGAESSIFLVLVSECNQEIRYAYTIY